MGMEPAPAAVSCLVTPDRSHVAAETLARFFGEIGVGDAVEWRAPFEAAVSAAVSAVLERTRPQQVRLRLEADEGAIVAVLRESGQWWQGEPSPTDVLRRVLEEHPGFFDQVQHWSSVGGHFWSLSKYVGTAAVDFRKAGSHPRVAELEELSRGAAQLGEAPAEVQLPYLDRADQLGELARSLRTLQERLIERDSLERSPIGISWLTEDLRWRNVNQASLRQLGFTSKDEVIGRSMLESLDPAVLARGRPRFLAATDVDRDILRLHNRYIRPDGTTGWLGIISIPLRDSDGRSNGFVAVSVDDTERTMQEERAVELQRRMFPEAVRIDGYEIAGRCMPADLMMSGDFYDWEVCEGRLYLTLADVMGKGAPAAIAMSALRTALRAVPADLGPARRLGLASDAMASMAAGSDIFVTVFHACVELTSGAFRFVDAGHGHWAVRRAGGELGRLHRPSLPMFVTPDEPFHEADDRLDPGDTLIVYSDGLVEVGDRTRPLDDYASDLAEAGDAQAMVGRLLGRTPAYLADDVTVVVLHRRAVP